MNNLKFDEENHTYTVDEKQKKSVTDVLKDFGFMPRLRFCTDEGMWRGSQIHKAIELYHKGTLNEDVLDPLIRPYLDAWRLFEAETGFQAWGWEKPLWDPFTQRCGRPDVWGQVPCGEIWILDYKSGGVDRVTGLQLAGYQPILINCGFIPRKADIKRFAIQLKPTGKYNIKSFNDDEDLVVWHRVNASFIYREEYVR